MPKILVTDYDNTLHLNDEDMKKNLFTIANFRKKHHIFIIATGRSLEDIQEEIEKYHIEYDYLIINHGATVLNEKGEILENIPILDEIKEELRKDLELQNQKVTFSCRCKESRVSMKKDHLTKIHMKFQTLEEAKRIHQYLNQKYSRKVISYLIPSIKSVEIRAANVNKAQAIKTVAKIEKISEENIYTIGDSQNDIEMIEAFHGFCMTNAKEEVKKVAKQEFESVSLLCEKILQEDINQQKTVRMAKK